MAMKDATTPNLLFGLVLKLSNSPARACLSIQETLMPLIAESAGKGAEYAPGFGGSALARR
jgi:hypothetical protein